MIPLNLIGRYNKGKKGILEPIVISEKYTELDALKDIIFYELVTEKLIPEFNINTIESNFQKILVNAIEHSNNITDGKLSPEDIRDLIIAEKENVKTYLKNDIKTTDFDEMVVVNKNNTRTFNHEKIAEYIQKDLKTVSWGSNHVAVWNGDKYDTIYGESAIKENLHRIACVIGYIKNISDLESGILKRLYQMNRKSNDYPFGKVYNKLFMRNGVVFVDPEDNYSIKLLPHDPSNLNDYVLNTSYNPDVDTTKALKWLDQFGNVVKTEYINLIATIFAHKMLYDMELFKIIFYIIGGKDTGKTFLFVKILQNIIFGTDNVSSLKLHEMSEKFMLINMVGKIVNIHDDTSGSAIKEASSLKGISGGSSSMVENKNEKPYPNRVWGSLLFTGNKMPLFDNADLETDPAFYERWIIMHLTERLCPPNTLDKDIKEGFKKAIPYDNDIIDGIVKLAIDKAAVFLKTGTVSGFQNSLKSEFLKYNDNTYRFRDDCLIRSPGNYVIFGELTEEYDLFADNNDISPRDRVRKGKMRDKMKMLGIESDYVRIDRSRNVIFFDIKIKNSERVHVLSKNVVREKSVA